MQCYPVEDVLLNCGTIKESGVVNGPHLVVKLSAGDIMTRDERMCKKTLEKYLMIAAFMEGQYFCQILCNTMHTLFMYTCHDLSAADDHEYSVHTYIIMTNSL